MPKHQRSVVNLVVTAHNVLLLSTANLNQDWAARSHVTTLNLVAISQNQGVRNLLVTAMVAKVTVVVMGTLVNQQRASSRKVLVVNHKALAAETANQTAIKAVTAKVGSRLVTERTVNELHNASM